MMDFSDRFKEVIAAAREAVRIKIRKHAGDLEDFDPETLLYSLFEAEVPLRHIFYLFDRIIERVVDFNQFSEITESQLHGLVTNSISAHPDSKASVWVTNYHNDYASIGEVGSKEDSEDFDLSDGDRLVNARWAFVIRRLVKNYLAQELEVPEEEIPEIIDAEDLREATTRILKVIRQSGLREVRLANLVAFIEELSRSEKKVIHRRFRNEEEARAEIDLAERYFEVARKLCDADLFMTRTQFQLALELLGRIFLTVCRLPSCPARQHSFQHMLGILRTLDNTKREDKTKDSSKKTKEASNIVSNRVNSALGGIAKDTRYQVKILCEASEILNTMSETLAGAAAKAMHQGRSSSNAPVTMSEQLAFDKGTSAFQTILYTARSLYGYGLGIGRSRIVRALAELEERSEKVCAAAAEFVTKELQLSCSETSSSAGMVLRVRELNRLKTLSDCLQHGQNALMLFRFGRASTPLSLADIQGFVFDVLSDSNSIGVVFTDQELESGLLKALKELSKNTGRAIIWMDTHTLNKMFLRPDAFLPTVDEYLKKALPWLNDSADQPRPEDFEMIPRGITGYVREALALLNRLEAERKWDAIQAEITPFLEEVAADYKHYFHHRVLQAIPKSDRSAVENWLRSDMARAHLGAASHFAEQCLSPTFPGAISAPQLKRSLRAFKDFIERVKLPRNRLAHGFGNPSEIANALSETIRGLGDLVQMVPYPSLYLCLPTPDNTLTAVPLFSAPVPSATVSGLRTGLVLALWSVGSTEDLLPKRVRVNRPDAGSVPLTIDLNKAELTGEAKSHGRLSPVLQRTLLSAIAKVEEDSNQTTASTRPGDLTMVSNWLARITANPAANSLPAALVATLSEYDQELATAAVGEALVYASDLLGVQVEVAPNGHGLVMKDESGGRIGCSIFDQLGLRDGSRIRDEINYWTESLTTGFSQHFAFLFADPTLCEEDIRQFKRQILTSVTTKEMATLDRVLEPKHTYFLLRRTGLEGEPPQPRSPDGGSGPPGKSGVGVVLSRGGDGESGALDSSTSDGLTKREVTPRYDVFISYNSEDIEEVREIVSQLRESGIIPWFDVDELRPGVRWRPVLEKLIEHTTSVAVFLGKSGVGPWQEEEMDAVLRKFLKLDRQVIPVVLPTGFPDTSGTLFLGNRTWVDFRSSSPPPLKQLIWGITGSRPG